MQCHWNTLPKKDLSTLKQSISYLDMEASHLNTSALACMHPWCRFTFEPTEVSGVSTAVQLSLRQFQANTRL